MKRLAMPLLASMISAAQAGEISSAYSDLDLGKCATLGPVEDGGRWRCNGHAGTDVLVWEGDLRVYLAYGDSGPGQCVSMQTFNRFNASALRCCEVSVAAE